MENKKISMLDYLINNSLIVGEEIETAKFIINSFRKQKSYSIGINYDKIYVDGGKQETDWESIFEANKNWLKIERILKEQAIFLEKYLCIEKTVEEYEKELKEEFDFIINKVVLLIEKINRLNVSSWKLMINELNKRVVEYGFKKTCRDAKINFKTLKKILENKKNINLKNLNKILKFFDII